MCTEFALIGASCTLDCMDLHRADAMLARGGKKTYLQPLWLRYGYIEAKNSFIIYGFNTLIIYLYIYMCISKR